MTLNQIPNRELEILACLKWREPATARNIREAMLPFHPMTHGSVFTLLTRLEAKGLVTKEKGPVGKAFLFSTTERTRKVFLDVLHQFLQRVFAGDSIQLIASIFEIDPPDETKIEYLEKLISDLKVHTRSASCKSLL